MSDAPNSLRSIFEKLGVETTVVLERVFGVAAEAQLHRTTQEGEKRSRVVELTRSAVLFGLGTEDAGLRGRLEQAGLRWEAFVERAGLSTFENSPVPKRDVWALQVDDYLLDALARVESRSRW